jgi:hypothetical protein
MASGSWQSTLTNSSVVAVSLRTRLAAGECEAERDLAGVCGGSSAAGISVMMLR